MVAAALAVSACGKAEDGNTITSNETISGDDTGAPLDDNAIADELGNTSDNAAAGPTNAL